MKKRLFLLLTVFSMSSFADFPSINIQNFKGSYNDPSGAGSAANFVFEELDFGKNPNFTVEKQANLIHLRTNTQEFTLENPPSFINDLETINWTNIALTSNGKNISLNVPSFSGESSKEKLNVSNLKLNCNHSGVLFSEVYKELLDSCLNFDGKVQASYIQFSDEKGTSLSNLNFTTKNNNLNFTINAGVNIKGYGKIYYEENNSKIRIRIDSAKAGIIGVVGRLFSELQALESDKVHVNRPWIEINM